MGQEKGNDDNNREKMSIRSEGLESVTEMSRPIAAGSTASKVRKASAVSAEESFAFALIGVAAVFLSVVAFLLAVWRW